MAVVFFQFFSSVHTKVGESVQKQRINNKLYATTTTATTSTKYHSISITLFAYIKVKLVEREATKKMGFHGNGKRVAVVVARNMTHENNNIYNNNSKTLAFFSTSGSLQNAMYFKKDNTHIQLSRQHKSTYTCRLYSPLCSPCVLFPTLMLNLGHKLSHTKPTFSKMHHHHHPSSRFSRNHFRKAALEKSFFPFCQNNMLQQICYLQLPPPTL